MIRTMFAALALSASPALSAQTSDLTYVNPIGGNWRYAAETGGTQASFVGATGTVQLTIRCARANRAVTISKPASAPVTSISVWTTAMTRTLAGTYDAAGAKVTATLAATDPLLDAIVFSRGRFGVTVPGSPPLVLPPWAEPARVVEDCRS